MLWSTTFILFLSFIASLISSNRGDSICLEFIQLNLLNIWTQSYLIGLVNADMMHLLSESDLVSRRFNWQYMLLHHLNAYFRNRHLFNTGIIPGESTKHLFRPTSYIVCVEVKQITFTLEIYYRLKKITHP